MLSSKNAFLIIVIVASLLIGGLIGFYFYTKTKNPAPTFLGRTSSGSNFSNYNPDNPSKTSSSTDTNIYNTPTSSSTTEVEVPKLRKISSTPTAGADFVTIDVIATTSTAIKSNVEPPDGVVKKVIVEKPRVVGSKVVIRFIERGTGHIFETATSTVENARISNTTIPKIYEAFFLGKGDNLILRDLIGNTDVIRTQYATLQLATTTSVEKELTTTDLPINISQIAKSPSSASIFSILIDGVRGILSKPDGGSKVALFDSPFKEWLVSWPREQTIVLTTKPSGFIPGYSYTLDTRTRAFTRLFGGINGLTTLPSPDVSRVLFSQSEGGSFKLGLYTQKDSSIKDLFIRTFPEKCVWSKTEVDIVYCAAPSDIAFNTYPDVWYQGLITFSDVIWKLNVVTGDNRIIMIPVNESGEIVDVINPQIDSKDDYLIFTNKIDLSLWGIQLKEPVKKVSGVNPTFLTSTSTATSTTR